MIPARKSETRQSNLVTAAFARLIQAAQQLLIHVSNDVSDVHHYDDVRQLLASVPLTTDEYALASQRLGNARRYAQQDEKGAARYELTQLVRNFAKRRQISES